MTFGIGAIGAVTKAVRTTQNLVQSVQEAVGFDKIFAADGVDSSEPESTPRLLERTVEAIRRRLSGDGLLPSGGLTFSSRDNGKLQIESKSDRGAAIETSMASDSTIRGLVSELHSRQGTTQITVSAESQLPAGVALTANPRASVVDLTH